MHLLHIFFGSSTLMSVAVLRLLPASTFEGLVFSLLRGAPRAPAPVFAAGWPFEAAQDGPGSHFAGNFQCFSRMFVFAQKNRFCVLWKGFGPSWGLRGCSHEFPEAVLDTFEGPKIHTWPPLTLQPTLRGRLGMGEGEVGSGEGWRGRGGGGLRPFWVAFRAISGGCEKAFFATTSVSSKYTSNNTCIRGGGSCALAHLDIYIYTYIERYLGNL